MTEVKSTRLVGKVAIVTASTDGIGYSIAKRLGQEGAKVVVSSRKQKNVDRAVEELRKLDVDVLGLVCHVGKKEHRERLFDETIKKYGKIDILVSNAASNPVFGPILDTPEEAWDKIMDVNVKSMFLLVQQVAPLMRQNGGGSIVLVSSVGGYHPSSMLGAYSVSKTALFGLTKAFTEQLADYNIRINCLGPGLIRTSFSKALWNNEAALDMANQSIPMRRIGEPDECAGAVAFLVSDDSTYMTGETIVVAGGVNSRL